MLGLAESLDKAEKEEWAMSNKGCKLTVFVVLLAFVGLRHAADARPQSVPVLQLELDQKIRARAGEYEKKLEALYEQRLNAWSRSFIERRRASIRQASGTLAAKANEIRLAKRLDWDEIRSDPDFREFERQQVLRVIDEPALRRELRSWAIEVEEQTRREMIILFRQLVAEDLGKVFDKELRGQVVKAVEAIPLEMLLAKDISLRKMEAAINAGLPKTTITRDQRASIIAASKVLATLGGIVWAYGLGLPDLLATQTGVILGEVAGWTAAYGVEVVNQLRSGEPDPALLTENFERALRRWRDEELLWRLNNVLEDFRERNLDTVESLAIGMNQS